MDLRNSVLVHLDPFYQSSWHINNCPVQVSKSCFSFNFIPELYVQTARKVSYLLWLIVLRKMVSTEYHRRRNGDFDRSQWKYKVWLQLLLVYTCCFHVISYILPCSVAACLYRQIHNDCGVLVCQNAKHLLYSSQLTQVCLLGLS